MHNFSIIDAHLHCGIQNVNWAWERIKPLHQAAGISGAGLIPPVEDIYDRYDPRFTDSPAWQACRRQAHHYLLGLNDPDIEIFRYFFVWNDFAWEDLTGDYVAIKWHRHPEEPVYNYADPRCSEFLQAVRNRGLPILLEETLANTLMFIEKLLPKGAPLIIPHLGGLSGGYEALKRAGVFALPFVYADTSTADPWEIEDYLGRCGPDRLLFASDYPFGHPGHELGKITALNLPPEAARAVLGDNFRRLVGGR